MIFGIFNERKATQAESVAEGPKFERQLELLPIEVVDSIESLRAGIVASGGEYTPDDTQKIDDIMDAVEPILSQRDSAFNSEEWEMQLRAYLKNME